MSDPKKQDQLTDEELVAAFIHRIGDARALIEMFLFTIENPLMGKPPVEEARKWLEHGSKKEEKK